VFYHRIFLTFCYVAQILKVSLRHMINMKVRGFSLHSVPLFNFIIIIIIIIISWHLYCASKMLCKLKAQAMAHRQSAWPASWGMLQRHFLLLGRGQLQLSHRHCYQYLHGGKLIMTVFPPPRLRLHTKVSLIIGSLCFLSHSWHTRLGRRLTLCSVQGGKRLLHPDNKP